jgi:hypothetical protein
MEETVTKLNRAIPAARKAISNEARYSLCLPTPLVKNIRLGTGVIFSFRPPSNNSPIKKYCRLNASFFLSFCSFFDWQSSTSVSLKEAVAAGPKVAFVSA